ncbi:MAG: hypothetical protein WCP69_07175 [Bacteroidota bacterium]
MKLTSFICSIALLSFCANINAQDISEEKLSFMDGKQDAIVAKYKYSEDVLETVVEKILSTKKIKKTKTVKGFKLYQGVFFEDLSKDVIDFYIKVDGGKTESTVTILISKGYNNFLSSSTDGSTIKNAKNLCKEINIAAIDEHLNRAIEKQTEVFNEANKKHNKSIEKGKDLVKEKEDILKKIEANIEEQKQFKQEVEDQKNALNALKSKK